jgi:hypothetical protein
MDLTTAQWSTFKTDINTNQAANVAAGNYDAIVAYYNANSSPAVSIWRPLVSITELNNAIVWSEFAGLTAAKQNCYIAMVCGPIDATQANIRSGFSTIFSSQGSQTLINLNLIAKRTGTRFEVLFSTVDGTASVSSLYGAVVTRNDVINALAS